MKIWGFVLYLWPISLHPHPPHLVVAVQVSGQFILIHFRAQLSCKAITHISAAVTHSLARRMTWRVAQMISWDCTVRPPLTNDLEVMAFNNFIFFIDSPHYSHKHYTETRLWWGKRQIERQWKESSSRKKKFQTLPVS